MKVSYKRKIQLQCKKVISKIVLFFLYKGFKLTYRYDQNVKKEVDSWENGFTAIVDAGAENVKLIMQKKNGKLIRLRKLNTADIEIKFKSRDVAFRMFTGRLGVSKAYAEHRFTLNGEITKAMSIVRCVDIVEVYLFPRIITKHILKAQPHKSMGIARTYLTILFV